jgi:hypothetical protein
MSRSQGTPEKFKTLADIDGIEESGIFAIGFF